MVEGLDLAIEAQTREVVASIDRLADRICERIDAVIEAEKADADELIAEIKRCLSS